MKLKDYIQGKRRGKEANKLEREALQDPFLQDALDGYDVVEGEHWTDIEKLEKRIGQPQKPKQAVFRRIWIWSAAAMLVVFMGTQIYKWTFQDDISMKPPVTVSQSEQLTEEKPDETVPAEKSKLSDTNKKEQTTSQKELKTASNLVKQKTISEILKGKELGRLELNKQLTDSEKPSGPSKRIVEGKLVDEHGKPLVGAAVVIKNMPGIGASTDADGNFAMEVPHDSITLLASYVGYEKIDIPVLADNGVYQMQRDDKELETVTVIGNLSQSKVSLAGSISQPEKEKKSKKQLEKTIRGRILDENSEPLIGARVALKNTDKGAVTNLNGEFTLKVPNNRRGKLDASFVGYLGQEVAVAPDVGDIRLQPDLALMDEVVVVGFGTEKKKSSAKTESVETVKIYPKATDEIEVFENKEQFIDYIKQQYKNEYCNEKSKTIDFLIKLDANGQIVEMTSKSFACPEMKNEFICIFENAPKWKLKNKKIRLKFVLLVEINVF